MSVRTTTAAIRHTTAASSNNSATYFRIVSDNYEEGSQTRYNRDNPRQHYFVTRKRRRLTLPLDDMFASRSSIGVILT